MFKSVTEVTGVELGRDIIGRKKWKIVSCEQEGLTTTVDTTS